jgi:hypothetical protein
VAGNVPVGAKVPKLSPSQNNSEKIMPGLSLSHFIVYGRLAITNGVSYSTV